MISIYSGNRKRHPVHYFSVLCKHVKHGNMEVQMGKHYLANNEWGPAIQAFKQAMEKGDLDNRDEVCALLEVASRKAGVTLT